MRSDEKSCGELCQKEIGFSPAVHAATALGLQSLPNAGEKEVRAWTIPAALPFSPRPPVLFYPILSAVCLRQVVDYNDVISAGSEGNARPPANSAPKAKLPNEA